MAKIGKIKVYWNASNSHHVVGYKLYWALNGGVNYDCESVNVGMRTEIILPDDIPAFPFVDSDVELGITAVTEKGNESDITKISASFEFAVPDAPSGLGLEDTEGFFVPQGTEPGSVNTEIEEAGHQGWHS